MEEASQESCRNVGCRRCSGRPYARALHDVDTHSREPAQCTGRVAARTGEARPGRGSGNALRKSRNSPSAREDLLQLLRRDHLQLRIRTLFRRLVLAPAAELRSVAKAVALHVVIRHFNDQLRTKRLPRQVLALAPSALRAGHAAAGSLLRPSGPRMVLERIAP